MMDDWDGPDLGPLTTGVDHSASRNLFHTRRRRHRRRRWGAVGAAAALVVFGVAAVATTGNDDQTQVASGPPVTEMEPGTSEPSVGPRTPVPQPDEVAHPTYLPPGYALRSERRETDGSWTSRYDPQDEALGQIQVITYRRVDAEFFGLGEPDSIELDGFEATLALTVPDDPDQGLKVITLRVAEDLAVRVVALGFLDVDQLVPVAASIEFGPVGTGREVGSGDPPPYDPPTAEMPDIVGATLEEAGIRLARASDDDNGVEGGGFLVPSYVANDEVPAGLIVDQGVPAGSSWSIYGDVPIEVSAGGPALDFAALPAAARRLAEGLDGYDTNEPVLESTTTLGAVYKTDAWFFGPCDAIENAAPVFADPRYKTSCY